LNINHPTEEAKQQNHEFAPLIEEYESNSVRHYILLGMVMRILDHDFKVIGLSQIKLPHLYKSMFRVVQDRVLLDMGHIKKGFRQSGIKIYEHADHNDGLFAQLLSSIFYAMGYSKG